MKKIFILIFSIFLIGCNQSNNKETIFYGNVDIRSVSLAFRVGGKVDNIYFDEGQSVKKGEIIASLNDSLYTQYLNEINAEVQSAKANVQKLENGYRIEDIQKAKSLLLQKEIVMNKAKKDFLRNSELLKNNSISKQQFDNIKEIYDSTKADFEYAKSNVQLLENGYQKEDIISANEKLKALMAQQKIREINLNDTKLIAPTDGVILTRAYEIGAIINASAPIVQMAKSDEYWIRSYMSEKYLGKIKPNMKAKIYTDSSSKVYEGVVSFISPIAEFTPKNVETQELRTDLVYRYRIVVKNFDDGLKQGMPVSIKFDEIR